jgi:hypothetical protein
MKCRATYRQGDIVYRTRWYDTAAKVQGKLYPRIWFFHMLGRVAGDCFEKGHRRMSVPGVQGNA